MDIKDIVALNRSGTPKALPSFCTANDHVLNDIVSFAVLKNVPVVIEATCNQVNQFGGYTGMKPADYAAKIRDKATTAGLSENQLILGGDHLGPNPWKHLPASEAMVNAKNLVKGYVEAGVTKIHLDASMACQGENTPSFELVAERSAQLCVVAEQYAPHPSLLSYVIGTEVPVPGGESDDMAGIQVTTPDRLAETVDTHKVAFEAAGVPQGIDRTIAVVVQPGVDFSHDAIFHYDRDKAVELTSAIDAYEGVAFEAHSTDYQSTENLTRLVQDHSVILKVGPEITFRFREGVMSLAHIEAFLDLPEPSRMMEVMQAAMEDDPSDWENYYQGSPQEVKYLKLFSYSDRMRYYWDKKQVTLALKNLLENITASGLRAAAASQYGIHFPIANATVDPNSVISQRIHTTIERYYQAAGWM